MPEWVPVAVTIALFVATIVNGIIGWFVRKAWDRVERLERDLADHKKEQEQKWQQLPFLYVLREDWIRYQAAIERKLDDIYKAVIRFPHTDSEGGDD